MNKRQEELLTYLTNSNNYEPIEMIANHFSVSVKTIRRDLAAIDTILKGSGNKIHFKRGSGVYLLKSPQGTEKTWQLPEYSKRLNQDRKERNLLQAFFLLFSEIEIIPLKALGYEFSVSHSQLLMDLKTLEDVFAPYSVSIINRDGIRLCGDRKNRNDLAVYLFTNYQDYGYQDENIVYPTAIDKNSFFTKQLITEQDREFLNRMMSMIENASSQPIWKQDYVMIFISLLCLIKQRLRERDLATVLGSRPSKWEYDSNLTTMILKEIKNEYAVFLDDSDIETINNIFLSTGLVHDPAFDQEPFNVSKRQHLIHDFAEDFIDAFSTITDIDLRANDTFRVRIHEHLEPMINRVLFNLGIADRFLETYGQEYHSTMNVCEVICWILAKKYGLPDIPRAEVLFLMLYIQTEIIEAESRLKVGFLTDDEKSIVNLQLARLSKEFPCWEVKQYQRLPAPIFYRDNLDFVITTQISLVDKSIPSVGISHKMSDLDLKLIKSTAFSLTSGTNRELIKLQNIFRDLLDLRCSIVFSHTPFDQPHERQELRIEGVGSCVFHYFDKGEGENSLYVQCPPDRSGKFHFFFSMNNWDFLLFASKIVFLIDRTIPDELANAIEIVKRHLEENYV